MLFPAFESFPKIERLKKAMTVIATEKIDGTNAQIYIDPETSEMFCGSRNRWLTPDDDNFGFARWCYENKTELAKLGPGRHYGEWFGSGIQRGYGLKEKRFYLFDSGRWTNPENNKPACCGTVPILAIREGFTEALEMALIALKGGSVAVPGWDKPEGVVLKHPRMHICYKWTYEGDRPKYEVAVDPMK